MIKNVLLDLNSIKKNKMLSLMIYLNNLRLCKLLGIKWVKTRNKVFLMKSNKTYNNMT